MKRGMLFAALLVVSACGKKQAEPKSGGDAKEEAPAEAPAAPGKLDVALNKITAELVKKEGNEHDVRLIGKIKVSNSGEQALKIMKIEYMATVGEIKSEGNEWNADPVALEAGAEDTLPLRVLHEWKGSDSGGDFMPAEEAMFSGTIYYRTGGEEKTEPFRLTSAVEKVAEEEPAAE